jgi:type I restriction enzyme S subunit
MGCATESTHDGFVIAFGRVGAYCGSIHWSLDGAWINNNASAVVPVNWPAFVLQTMLNIDFNSMRTGSAQPFIPNSSLASANVLRPSSQIAEAFCGIVAPLRRMQSDNENQSCTLATLRDTLLPKLLSGELSVTETAGGLSAR